MVTKILLNGNKKVPAGCYFSNIPLTMIKRKKTIYLKFTLTNES